MATTQTTLNETRTNELATATAAKHTSNAKTIREMGRTPAAPTAANFAEILTSVIERKANIAGASAWMVSISRAKGHKVLSNAQKAKIIALAMRKAAR